MPAEGSTAPHRRGLLEASSDLRVGQALGVRSLVFDVLVALLFVALGLVLLEIFTQRPTAADRAFVVLVNAPLALRRRLPRTGFLLAYGFGLLQIATGVRIGVHDAGLLFALYSAVGCNPAPFGRTALGLGVVTAGSGAATGWWGWVDRQLVADPGFGTRLASLAGALVLVGCSWALGRRLHTARLGSIALAERAARAEREQQQLTALATAAERRRIAREMHDVVAHGLTVMVVQADAAGFVFDQSPEDARRAIGQIATTGRESMVQMRSLLGLLRDDDADRTSTPGLDGIAALVEQAEQAGAHITLRQNAVPDVPELVALTAYRVVQEGLTNARKHGGPGVVVEVGRTGSALRVRVTNDPPAEATSPSQDLGLGSGLGLLGARERVAAVGGTMRSGQDPDGRFVIAVELPLTGR